MTSVNKKKPKRTTVADKEIELRIKRLEELLCVNKKTKYINERLLNIENSIEELSIRVKDNNELVKEIDKRLGVTEKAVIKPESISEKNIVLRKVGGISDS